MVSRSAARGEGENARSLGNVAIFRRLVKPGGWSAAVVNGDARQPGRAQLFALLRERNIPFVVHSCDPITEREIAQVPHVGKPAPPSKIVASPADRRTRTLTGT